MSGSIKSEIKKIRRSLNSSEFEEIELMMARESIPVGERAALLVNIRMKRREQLDRLDDLESRYLIRQAQSYGIEVPFKREWYTVEIKNPDPDNLLGEKVTILKDYLNDIGKAVVTKQIRDERRASVKWWADILIPVLALIVAIGAVFKDVMIAYIQSHR